MSLDPVVPWGPAGIIDVVERSAAWLIVALVVAVAVIAGLVAVGDVMRPFSGQVDFSTPSADRGALVFLTTSAEDGRVWQAAVLRVQFG